MFDEGETQIVSSGGGTASSVELPLPLDLAQSWLERLERAFEQDDLGALDDLVLTDGWWRDLLALTWDLRSAKGPENIRQMLTSRPGGTFTNARLDPGEAPSLVESGSGMSWVQAMFRFDTAHVSGVGVVRLVEEETHGHWKAWTVLTSAEALLGFPERRTTWNDAVRPEFVKAQPNKKAWRQLSAQRKLFADREPAVLVIGAGQHGLNLTARLERLGVDTLVVDKNERVGDSWRNRYSSLILHDPTFTHHLAYLRFPSDWPFFPSKDHMGDWLESYARVMDIPVHVRTEVVGGSYDTASGQWTVEVRRDGESRSLHPRHVVVATGLQGTPSMPETPGVDTFAGTVLHSSEFFDGNQYRGKQAVVIGAGASGHDIAQELWEQGASVTLVQRSPTCVISVDQGLRALVDNPVAGYDDQTVTEHSDMLAGSLPWPLALELDAQGGPVIAELDKELLDGLHAVGYETHSGGLLKSGALGSSGIYIDQGCCELIIERKILIKHGSVARLSHRGVLFEDGSTAEADLVVCATGFQNMRESARAMLGNEVADQCIPVWGIDWERNEMASVWTDSGHPGLWFVAGNLQYSRFYSKYLALRLKAIEEGLTDQAG
jgi:cation diffusion facilitator CzcD-associated flavoprotein CzcO